MKRKEKRPVFQVRTHDKQEFGNMGPKFNRLDERDRYFKKTLMKISTIGLFFN